MIVLTIPWTARTDHSAQVVLPPITSEHLCNGIKIDSPITMMTPATMTVTNPTPMLINHLTTSLGYKIQLHANLYTLHKTIGQGQAIFIVSDVSVNHQGNGIHTLKAKLWSGKGIVPGPANDMFSGLTKAMEYTLHSASCRTTWTNFPMPSRRCPKYTYIATI